MRLLAFGLVLLVVGCATDYSSKSPAEIAQNMQIVDSEFDKSKLIAAPPINHKVNNGLSYTARLMAMKDKSTGAVQDAISVDWDYRLNRWFFFEGVDIAGGKSLDSSVAKRNVHNCGAYGICSYTETIHALIPRDLLESSKDGLRLRFNSKNGLYVVELPANYIEGYLKAVK